MAAGELDDGTFIFLRVNIHVGTWVWTNLAIVVAILFWHIHVLCWVFLQDKNESGNRTCDLLSDIVSLFFDTKRLLPHELAALPCAHTRPKSKKSRPSGARTRASSNSSSSSVKELIADSSRPTSPNATITRQTEESRKNTFGLANTGQQHQAQGSQEQGGHGQSQWMEHMTDFPSLPQHVPSNNENTADILRADSYLVHMARCTTQPPRPRSSPPRHLATLFRLTHHAPCRTHGDSTDVVTDVLPASLSISSGSRYHEDLQHTCGHGTAESRWSASSQVQDLVHLIHY